MWKSRFAAPIFSLIVMFLMTGMVFSQDYPNKTIRIFTNAPGGSGDAMSRAIAAGISGPLGQPVVVENKGSVGPMMSATVNTPPDGYGMGVTGGGAWNLPLIEKTAWDMADVKPVTITSRDVLLVVAHPSFPVNSIKELIALAKAKPGSINFGGTAGGGGKATLGMQVLASMADIKMVNINYVGTDSLIIGLVSGEIPVAIAEVGMALPQVKSGKLKALAVTSGTPSELTPGLPTVAATLPGYEWVGMTAVLIPAKTPDAIVSRLNREIVRTLIQPSAKQQFLARGTEIVANSPEQAAAAIKTEITNTLKVMKEKS